MDSACLLPPLSARRFIVDSACFTKPVISRLPSSRLLSSMLLLVVADDSPPLHWCVTWCIPRLAVTFRQLTLPADVRLSLTGVCLAFHTI